MSGQPDPRVCDLCSHWVFPESLKLYEGRDEDDKRSYCAGCGSFVGVEDDDDPPFAETTAMHCDECTCRECFDLLRHNHDRAQAQAFALLSEQDEIANDLRAIADRLSRHTS